jgi:hypothetical protein
MKLPQSPWGNPDDALPLGLLYLGDGYPFPDRLLEQPYRH